MTVENLLTMLKKYPPSVRVFTYNAKGVMVEANRAEILAGADEVWHEQQGEDVLFIE